VKNIIYFTIEDISSGLFQTQIIDTLQKVSKNEKDIDIQVLVINRPWQLIKNMKSKKRISDKIINSSIQIKYVPLLPPLRNALNSVFYSSLITWWLTILCKVFTSKKVDIIHCRSYWPTKAALNSKMAPVIFDMRSLWVLENLSMGNLRENSPSYKYWTDLEKDCLLRSNLSTAVSESMKQHVISIVPNCNIKLVPISVDIDKFGFNKTKRLINRKKLSWMSNNIFVYSGSLGMSNINQSAIKMMIKALLDCNNINRVLFLTMEDENKVTNLMNEIKIKHELYKIIHPKLEDIYQWLSAADIGIHALPRQLDSGTRLGTKVVEYWGNGLPVIVNQHVGAAAEFIESFKLGAVLKDDQLLDLNYVSQRLETALSKTREEIANFARKQFSSEIIAYKYLENYRECIVT
jgi:glycosyltransferase involved in cell wall biosynthesis